LFLSRDTFSRRCLYLNLGRARVFTPKNMNYTARKLEQGLFNNSYLHFKATLLQRSLKVSSVSASDSASAHSLLSDSISVQTTLQAPNLNII
jgi:hypothetical protein